MHTVRCVIWESYSCFIFLGIMRDCCKSEGVLFEGAVFKVSARGNQRGLQPKVILYLRVYSLLCTPDVARLQDVLHLLSFFPGANFLPLCLLFWSN